MLTLSKNNSVSELTKLPDGYGSKSTWQILKEKDQTKSNTPKKRSEFYDCGNCNQKLHTDTNTCTGCGYIRSKRNNWINCPACNQRTPISSRRKYTRSNQWDNRTSCDRCGKQHGITHPVEFDTLFFERYWHFLIPGGVLVLV
jgi:hypothetical protein